MSGHIAVSQEDGRIKGRVRASILSLTVVLVTLIVLCIPSLAGTEDGSFCPTCPDWTNLDGWFAQKNSMSGNSGSSPVSKPNGEKATQVPDDPVLESSAYPLSHLITKVGEPLVGLVVIDVRSLEEYGQGHIPGARSLDRKNFTSNGSLDLALAGPALRRTGMNSSDTIVVYGGGGSSDNDAAYFFWALEYLGHQNVSVLEGGIEAWTTGGLPLEKAASKYNVSSYTLSPRPLLLVNSSSLDAFMSSPDVQVIDSRESFADFGRSHLKNAIQIPAVRLYDGNRIKGPKELKDLFEGRGLVREKVQLVYGPEAATLYWGLRLMGYNATVVDGDWWTESDWAVSNIH